MIFRKKLELVIEFNGLLSQNAYVERDTTF